MSFSFRTCVNIKCCWTTVTILITCLVLPIVNSEFVGNNGAESFLFFKPKVTGLVLARCGSKGITFKNLAKIRGETLLRRTLRILQLFGRFDDIWVSTDCNEIQHEALLAGAQVHHRSIYSASDSASSLFAVQEFLHDNPDVEIVGLFQCTSPFLALPFIHSAYSLLLEGYDSVFSVMKQHKLRWKILPDGQAAPLNFHPAHRPRRQDWEGELVENGMFYFSHSQLIKRGLLQGGRIAVVEVPGNCSLEIDSQADLDVAVVRAQRIGQHTC